MRIGVKCNSYITMSHKILQRFWIHAGFRHIAAIRVPANMRRNIRHLYPIDIVVPLHHVVKAMFPMHCHYMEVLCHPKTGTQYIHPPLFLPLVSPGLR